MGDNDDARRMFITVISFHPRNELTEGEDEGSAVPLVVHELRLLFWNLSAMRQDLSPDIGKEPLHSGQQRISCALIQPDPMAGHQPTAGGWKGTIFESPPT